MLRLKINNIYYNNIFNLYDLVYNFNITFEKFKSIINMLEIIFPRLYSISSSPTLHMNVIHITVLKKKNNTVKKRNYGLCSYMLCNLNINDIIYFSIYKNNKFRLPNENKNIILISTGVGIAPFRSFLFERYIKKCSGKNWLFFGNQYYNKDFLYKDEIINLYNIKLINKINLAFSRDKNKKIYVQHIIWNKRNEIFNWIYKKKSFIYVCGSCKMGKCVKLTIKNIINNFLCIEKANKFYKKIIKDNIYVEETY